jgi:hypothetical protein
VQSHLIETWHARVVLGPKPEHQIESDTGTVHLQDALLRGQSLYQAARSQAAAC